MNVIIAGGGIAGLSAAAVLRKLPFVKSIVIFEPVLPMSMSQSTSKTHNYNGIWSPALQCLQSLGIYGKISPHFHAVSESGYKDVSGRWLAQPTFGLQVPPMSPSLAFIENELLLGALREDVLSPDPQCCDVRIRFGDKVTDVTVNAGDSLSVTVKDSNEGSHRADLLIASDGTFSSVFSSMYASSGNRPAFRGYRVYRGYSEVPPEQQQHGEGKDMAMRACEFAFQTWGPGSRFACVPTVKGSAWYLAVTASTTMCMDSSSNSDSNGTIGEVGSVNGEGISYLYQGPFSNGSVCAGEGEFQVLKEQFSHWHAPIGEILRSTVRTEGQQGASGVRVCDAYSFNSSTTVSAEHTAGRFLPIVFVGDAAHTLDPILAQGAGVAIEDCWLLGEALRRHYRYRSYDSFTVQSYGEEEEKNKKEAERVQHTFARDCHTVDIKAFQLDFEKSRRTRIRVLEFFTEVSQVIGQVASPALCRLRDLALLMVPRAVKGAVFDLSIRAVSTFDSHAHRQQK